MVFNHLNLGMKAIKGFEEKGKLKNPFLFGVLNPLFFIATMVILLLFILLIQTEKSSTQSPFNLFKSLLL